MNVLVTGYAGFIGYHLTNRLMDDKSISKILAVDNLNNYYDTKLKKDRIKKLRANKNYKKIINLNIDINNFNKLLEYSKRLRIKIIFHLAAQAGIRYSFISPRSYIDSNLKGFFNILEIARQLKIKKFIYASSSSVYGESKKTPYSEKTMSNQPLQLYAATKISNEVMAYAYSNLYKFTSIGLRFFTVYGPYGRPDMAIYKFVDAIYKNKKITIYGANKMQRDFTYIDDVIDGILKIFSDNSNMNRNLSNVYNLGLGKPVYIHDIIKKIELITGKKATLLQKKSHNSEMNLTHCSIKKLKSDYDYQPKIKIGVGLSKFIEWYKAYNNVN